MTGPIASPEEGATSALHQLLVDAFDGNGDVGVHDHVPNPRVATRPVNVWLGGHSADERFASHGGPSGPSLEQRFRIEVFAQSRRPGSTGAQVRADTFAALTTLRSALTDAIRDRRTVAAPAGTFIAWQRIASHSSTGPAPTEDGGYDDVLQAEVEFLARIRRSTP